MPVDLIQIVDSALASSALRSGSHLACHPGCTQCCHGIFAISQQDAARLREGLQLLSQRDPGTAKRIRTRVADALSRLTPGFPGDPVTGILPQDYEDSPAFNEFANDEPCPVLDPTTGTCDLYQHRPTLCRIFGPPLRDEDGNLTHCELCYTAASPEQVLACEIDPTLPDVVAASDEAFNATLHLHGETLVAFALRET